MWLTKHGYSAAHTWLLLLLPVVVVVVAEEDEEDEDDEDDENQYENEYGHGGENEDEDGDEDDDAGDFSLFKTNHLRHLCLRWVNRTFSVRRLNKWGWGGVWQSCSHAITRTHDVQTAAWAAGG